MLYWKEVMIPAYQEDSMEVMTILKAVTVAATFYGPWGVPLPVAAEMKPVLFASTANCESAKQAILTGMHASTLRIGVKYNVGAVPEHSFECEPYRGI